MYKLKFEYTDEFGNTTKVEKEFENYMDRQFDTLMWEIRTCLLACGFGQELIDDYMQLE